MLSVQGPSQSGLYRLPEQKLADIDEKGFEVLGKNRALDDVMGENDHYLDVIQSRKYIRENWGMYFSIVEIVDAMAANQDVVVLRKS